MWDKDYSRVLLGWDTKCPFLQEQPSSVIDQAANDIALWLEAEEHAAEDKERREAADLRNSAEQLQYSVDKVLADNDDKLADEVKNPVKEDVTALKTALAGDDDAAVKAAFEKLQASQSTLGEAIYAAAQAEGATADADASEGAASSDAGAEEDIVDAEIIDEDEKK